MLREHRVVSDEPATSRGALERLGAEVDVLLVTGGLGPTDDDRTVDVVSALAGVEATPHGPSLEAMRRGFAARGFELTPNNLRQVRGHPVAQRGGDCPRVPDSARPRGGLLPAGFPGR